MAEPGEAKHLPVIPYTEVNSLIFTEILVAVNGFAYAGERADAIAYAIRWMRAHPKEARIILDLHPGLDFA